LSVTNRHRHRRLLSRLASSAPSVDHRLCIFRSSPSPSPSLETFFPAMTKIVGTLGPKSRSADIIANCLNAGMSGSKCHR
ncbi:hypothetical protein NL676_019538, partial [Syzygium grande]